MAVDAACFRAKLAGQPTPASERTGTGARRLPADRQRDLTDGGALFRWGRQASWLWRCPWTLTHPSGTFRSGMCEVVPVVWTIRGLR